VAGSCEHGNAISGSLKGREILYQLSDYQLLRTDSSPRNKIENGQEIHCLSGTAFRSVCHCHPMPSY
jgi:hypothetical protein